MLSVSWATIETKVGLNVHLVLECRNRQIVSDPHRLAVVVGAEVDDVYEEYYYYYVIDPDAGLYMEGQEVWTLPNNPAVAESDCDPRWHRSCL